MSNTPISLTILAGSDQFKALQNSFIKREETPNGAIEKYELFYKNNLFWATFYFGKEAKKQVLADQEGISILSNGIGFLHEIYASTKDEDLPDSQIQIGGLRFIGLVELLLSYAAVYENVDIKQLGEMVKTEKLKVSYDAGNRERH